MTKIKLIDGNLEQHSLGISTNDRDWLIENVNFVFHCAATVRFNETLQMATRVNVQGTENLLALATEMKNLKVIEIDNLLTIMKIIYNFKIL